MSNVLDSTDITPIVKLGATLKNVKSTIGGSGQRLLVLHSILVNTYENLANIATGEKKNEDLILQKS